MLVTIKSSLIPIPASPFSCHDYVLVSSSLQHAFSAYRGPRAGAQRSTRKTTSRFQWWWRERGFSSIAINESHWRSYFQINAYPGSSGGSVRGVTSIAINKSHWWEPR